MGDIEINIRVQGGTVEHTVTTAKGMSAPLTAVEQDNLRVVMEHLEGIKARDITKVAAGLDDRFEVTSDTRLGLHPSRTGDKRNYLELFHQLWKTFPDTVYENETEPIVRGEYVVVPWWGHGTQQDTWAGQPATRKRMDIHGCSYYRLRDKKIVALWDYWDRGALTHQGGQGGGGGPWGGGNPPTGGTPPELSALLRQLEGVLRKLAAEEPQREDRKGGESEPDSESG